MKCLTVRQPWASAILEGTKTKEYRSWPTSRRGPLAIHAGTSTADLNAKGKAALPRGCLLGVVDVVDCVWDEAGGCYAWKLANPRALAKPVPMKGLLKLWQVDDRLLAGL